MHEDFDRCYRAVQSKDARFDGWFVTAVLTTKIYCRPSCPVRPPFARNMRFYPTAAAAQRAGFRACKRCRPDASPGSPEWNVRGDVVARAMRLIADGTVDREGVTATRERRATVALDRLETLWINTGTLCNITCQNCYIESSPSNDRLVYITAAEAAAYFDEIEAGGLGTREIGFTGGEPFMNPQLLAMVEDALQRGFEVLVLTNAMQPMQRPKIKRGLLELERSASARA